MIYRTEDQGRFRFVYAHRPPEYKYHLSSKRSFRDTQNSQVHPDYSNLENQQDTSSGIVGRSHPPHSQWPTSLNMTLSNHLLLRMTRLRPAMVHLRQRIAASSALVSARRPTMMTTMTISLVARGERSRSSSSRISLAVTSLFRNGRRASWKRWAGIRPSIQGRFGRRHESLHRRNLLCFRIFTCWIVNPPVGIRTVRTHRHASATAGRVRDWPRLYVHDTETSTARHQSWRQKFDTGRSRTSPPAFRLSWSDDRLVWMRQSRHLVTRMELTVNLRSTLPKTLIIPKSRRNRRGCVAGYIHRRPTWPRISNSRLRISNICNSSRVLEDNIRFHRKPECLNNISLPHKFAEVDIWRC